MGDWTALVSCGLDGLHDLWRVGVAVPVHCAPTTARAFLLCWQDLIAGLIAVLAAGAALLQLVHGERDQEARHLSWRRLASMPDRLALERAMVMSEHISAAAEQGRSRALRLRDMAQARTSDFAALRYAWQQAVASSSTQAQATGHRYFTAARRLFDVPAADCLARLDDAIKGAGAPTPPLYDGAIPPHADQPWPGLYDDLPQRADLAYSGATLYAERLLAMLDIAMEMVGHVERIARQRGVD